MVTKMKTGSLPQSKAHLVSSEIIEPKNATEAIVDPLWFQAMQTESEALKRNQTWILVPASSTQHVVLVYVLIYVDDILLIGPDSQFIKGMVAELNNQFSLKDLGEMSFFLGLEARRSDDGLWLCQAKYAMELLQKVSVQECNAVTTPMTVGGKLFTGDSPLFERSTMYKSVIRALQYLTLTRLDLSYFVNKLSQFLKEPTQLQ